MPNLEDVSPALSSSVAQGGVADSAGGISYSGEAFDATAGAVAFQGPTADFILYGVVNGAFAQGPPDSTQNIDPIDNPMPYWYGPTQVSGGAITCTWVADSASPSGYNLRFTINPGAAGDEAYVEQIVPIGGDRNRATNFIPRGTVYRVTATGAGAPTATIAFQYLKADGTTTGSAVTGSTTLSADATLYNLAATVSIAPPADAYSLRLRYGVARNTMATTDTASVDIVNVRTDRWGRTFPIPEQASQTTYGPGYLFQTAGSISLIASRYTHGTEYLTLNSATSTSGLAAADDIEITATTGRILLNNATGVNLNELASSPATPTSGYYKIYPKTDGKLYGKNDAGTETELGGGGTISNALVMSNIISPTVSANTNNWAPAGFATAVGVSPDVTGATRTITGFDSTGCTQGQAWLIMPRTNDLVIAAKSASSSPGNRVRCANATNKTIGNGGGAWMYYDPASDANNPFVLITNA
jgi:hypothetical protein